MRRTERLSIPIAVVRHVIGSGERTIKDIKFQSGAKVTIDSNRDHSIASETTQVTIQYREERQRIVAETMIRNICNNHVQVYTHPEINVTLVIAGSLLEKVGAQVATGYQGVVSFATFRAEGCETRGGNFKTCLRVAECVGDRIGDQRGGLTDALQAMAISDDPFEAKNDRRIVVERSSTERDRVEGMFASHVAKFAHQKLKESADWRVEVGFGDLVFYDVRKGRRNGMSIQAFQNSKIGRDKDMKIKFNNRIPDEKVELFKQFLVDSNFELKSDEEVIAMHLVVRNRSASDRRVGVNVQVQRESRSLSPMFITRGQIKPLFMTCQHAIFLKEDDSSVFELPKTPKVDVRIRLQINERSEKIDENISQFVTQCAALTTWDADRLIFRATPKDGPISISSIRIKRIRQLSDGVHVVAFESIHDHHGNDVHTEVTINSEILDIREQQEEEIRSNIASMFDFTRKILENVFIE